MGSFFNLVSDPVLAQRQEALNSQWFALNQTIDSCALTASSAPAFSQFYADFDSWKAFFASGSDWSSDSKRATDAWQKKLQEYTALAKNYCQAAAGAEPAYIPGVKDPPPDEASLLDKGLGFIKAPFEAIDTGLKTVSIAVVVIVGAILFAIIYVAAKGSLKAGPSGVSLGK